MTDDTPTAPAIAYGRTPQGQLLYDLGFTRLTPQWLARKYNLPIVEIRRMRKAARKALGYPRIRP